MKTTTFGAFVSLLPGRDGLLHITQIRKLHGGARIDNVDDVIKVGDKIQVEIREVDDRGKLSLVPVEVVEREAAGEDLGGARRPPLARPGDRGGHRDRDRGSDRGGDATATERRSLPHPGAPPRAAQLMTADTGAAGRQTATRRSPAPSFPAACG